MPAGPAGADPRTTPPTGVPAAAPPAGSGRLVSLLAIGAAVGLGAMGQVLLKAGAAQWEGRSLLGTLGPALTDPLVVGGLLAYAVSSVLWLVVLSRVALSVAYPLAAMSYVIVVGAGVARGEHVSATRWLGVLLIVAGVSALGTIEARGRRRVRA